MYQLGVWDYVVLALTLLLSAAIGVYYRFSGGKQKTTEEYLLAGRNMPVIPVAFSVMASFMSSITLLGVSSENYLYGSIFALINISYLIGTPIAAYFYLPVFYELQTTSAYQYLEMRFGRPTRLATSLAFIVQMVLYMGIVVYGPALAISAVTGLDKVGAIIAVGLVCTFYSTVGGMKAVLISDLFQSFLMFGSVLCVAIKGTIDAGGVEQVWNIAAEGGRLNFWDFSFDPTVRHTFWTQVVGGLFLFLSNYAVSQTQIQRLLTVSSLKKSQGAIWLNWPILTSLSLITCFSGLAIYSRYAHCDPFLEGEVAVPDQLLPYYVIDTLGSYPGVAGLFIAGIFSGSLSSVSSSLNSLAAVTMQDFLTPIFFKRKTDRTLAWICQVVAVVYGLVCIGVAFAAEYLGGVLQAALTIFGVVGGPIVGLFTVGMFSTAVEETGALSSFLIGLAFSLWVGFGGPKPPIPILPQDTSGCTHDNVTVTVTPDWMVADPSATSAPPSEDWYFPLYTLSYMWNAPLGFLVVVVISQLVSRILRIFKRIPKLKDPKLLSPLFPKVFMEKELRTEERGSHVINGIVNDALQPEEKY